MTFHIIYNMNIYHIAFNFYLLFKLPYFLCELHQVGREENSKNSIMSSRGNIFFLISVILSVCCCCYCCHYFCCCSYKCNLIPIIVYIHLIFQSVYTVIRNILTLSFQHLPSSLVTTRRWFNVCDKLHFAFTR